MSSKSFVTISKQECLTVYKDILKHSDKKWASGQKLTEIDDFGGATALAIISVEEQIKALIIFLDGKGFEFRSIKGINTLFEHHQIRYFLAYAMFIMDILGDEFIKFIQKTRKNPQEVLKLKKEMEENKSALEKKVMFYAFRKFILLKKEFEWFAKIDLFRQDGFYSDYEEKLKSPITISPEDYGQVISRLEKVRTVGKRIIEGFNTTDKQSLEQFENIKKEFKRKEYYKKLGNALTTAKQTRESPFELIRIFFRTHIDMTNYDYH